VRERESVPGVYLLKDYYETWKEDEKNDEMRSQRVPNEGTRNLYIGNITFHFHIMMK